jgi:monoterpene epsilon-lactone hydrolase
MPTFTASRGWICVPTHAIDGQALLFLHGGAYVMGTAPAYRGFASQIASRARRRTFILDYPLAPETALPVAIELAVAAVERLHDEYGLIGDSAGGGLALATLTRTDKASVAAVFSPWLDIPASLPPLLVQVGTDEFFTTTPCATRSRRARGHDITLQEWTSMHHVFQQNVEQLEAARHALDLATDFLHMHMERRS